LFQASVGNGTVGTVVPTEIRHSVIYFNFPPQRVLSPFRGGGIVYLNDPDSYAGWSFYTPVRATQARQVEG